MKRIHLVGSVIALALLAAAIATTGAARASASQPSDYIVGSISLHSGGGAPALVTQLDGVSICDKDLSGPGHCSDTALGFVPGEVGTTVWADASSPNFDLLAQRISNGVLGEVGLKVTIAGGGGGPGGLEWAMLGDQVGPNGFDLAGYTINRIGFRLDALSFDSPGEDFNGDGIWTDYTIEGAFLFEGTISSRDVCKHGGWQRLRGPGGAPFDDQGQCVRLAANGR
jgi:hypothetical protein